jgi:hypothetical protein
MLGRAMSERRIFKLSHPGVTRAIREVYKGECQYCGAQGADHVDHIIPSSKGGEDVLSNYILACARCNMRKGNGEIAPQYLALITAIAQRHERSVRDRIARLSNGASGYRIGLSQQISTFVAVNRHAPTLEQYRNFRLTMAWYEFLKSILDAAEPQDRTA